MDQKLITFAVPCYNSAAYMRHCIETLLSAGERAEIILVDDGSPDSFQTSHAMASTGLDTTRKIPSNPLFIISGTMDFIIAADFPSAALLSTSPFIGAAAVITTMSASAHSSYPPAPTLTFLR